MRIETNVKEATRETGQVRGAIGMFSMLSRLLSVTIVFSIVNSVAPCVLAQEYDFNELPVLNPKPDFNGVDPSSGSYITVSPLSVSAPGASNLLYTSFFNGIRESFPLNIYIEDQTFAFFGQESTRHLRVHLGGTDKLFTCTGYGFCRQDVDKDGSMLDWVSRHNFIFTDKNGAVYTFFPTEEEEIDNPNCNNINYDDDFGCNHAGYYSWAYVSSIRYPSGEKLTYLPVFQLKTIENERYIVQTIESNLGYKLSIENPTGYDASNVNDNPQWKWWFVMRVMGRLEQTNVNLYYGDTLIRSLVTKRVGNLTVVPSVEHVTQTDDLGRTYQIDYQLGEVNRCANSPDDWGRYIYLDETVRIPTRTETPGGVETYIAYHMQDANQMLFRVAAGGNSIPVYSIRRGGYEWTYNNVYLSKTITDPNQKTRSVKFKWVEDGYDYFTPNTDCPYPGTMGADITQYMDELNRSSSYDYNGTTIKSASLPENNGYHYDYDSRGNLTQITQIAKPGQGLSNRIIFQAGYPATCVNPKTCNKPEWVKDAKGNQTDYTYYPEHGGVWTVTQPARPNGIRPTTTYEYESVDTGDGIIYRQRKSSFCTEGSSCDGTADELETITTYWGNTFLPATITNRAGDLGISSTKSFTYDDASNVIEATDAMDQTTYTFYDAVGRKVGAISPDPDGSGPLPRQATRTTYNDDDQPTLVETGTTTGTSKPALNTMTVTKWLATRYDSLGRKIEDKTGSGTTTYGITDYSYDVWNRLICAAVRMNLSNPPTDACTLGTTGSAGPDRITKNIYDDAGQLAQVIRAYGTSLQQVYAAYEYSPNGKQTAVTDANNNRAKLEYDGYDRQTRWYFPSKTKGSQTVSSTDYEQYGYDDNDNRTSLRQRNGDTLTFDYDNLNRLIEKHIPARSDVDASHTQDVYYGYDNSGLQEYARFGSYADQGITRVFDALGRMKSSTINLDGVPRPLTYTYNANGFRTSVTHPDNETFVYTPDHLTRLAGISHNSVNTLASYSYTSEGYLDSLSGGVTTRYGYDGIGRVTSLTHDLAGTSNDNHYGYSYIPSSQIGRITASNGAYAPVVTQLNKTYVANGLNQYTDISGAAYQYDDNGNLIDDGQTLYTFDQENRLVKANVKNGGALKAELWYDPLGRLYKVQGPGATTTFLYDGDELVAEFNGTSTTVQQRYVHGISMDDPVAWFSGSSVSENNERHLRANRQGSIVVITDNDGNKIAIPRYDSWGNLDSTPPVRFGYTGQAWIPELGLWYYKARMYSPELGRFLQTDPIGYEDQMNLYAYVGNDPLNATDPSGMFLVAGFLMGAGIEIVAQLATQGTVTDWKSVAISGAVGIVTGGIGGRLAVGAAKGIITTSQAVTRTAAVAGVTSGVGSVAGDVVNGKEVDVTKAAISTVTGAVGGAVGAKIANAGTAALEKMAAKGGIAANVAATTRSAQLAPRAEVTTSGVQKAATTASDAAIAASQKELEKRVGQ